MELFSENRFILLNMLISGAIEVACPIFLPEWSTSVLFVPLFRLHDFELQDFFFSRSLSVQDYFVRLFQSTISEE